MKIANLPYLEECSGVSCEGGFVDAQTYAVTGPGFADAGAFAFAAGYSAFATTRTVTMVRQNRNVTISHARAFSRAIAITDDGIERDRSFSISTDVYRNPR